MNKVVIVGRMNVGKSTLFNRLSTNVKSIILDYEGVTRDFIKDVVEWKDSKFELYDCGGITLRKTTDIFLEKIRSQVINLIESSDLVIFLVDGIAGVTPEDIEISKALRKTGKQILLVVNKFDSKKAQENFFEFERLGYSNIIAISAQHATAINDLLDLIIELLPKKTVETDKTESLYNVMLLGKPNVGKSSLMNALLNEERSFVSDIPGTTREALSEKIMFYKQAIELTDTPGIRRKRSVEGEIEPLMVHSAFSALKKSDIILLLIDGSENALADQELKLAFYAFTEHYKALILLVNKADLMTEISRADLERSFSEYKHLLDKIPVVQISCKTGKNIGKILPLVHNTWSLYSQQFDDSVLTNLFMTSILKKPLYNKTRLLKLFKVRQIKNAPIIIELVVNEPDWFQESQLKFFENILRNNFDLTGIPVKFIVKKNKSS